MSQQGLTDIGKDAWDAAIAAAREVSAMREMVLEVGILEGKGADTKHDDSELTIAAIAGVHEFGASITVPAHETTIRREMVAMDILTREYRGGLFVKAKKPGYETTHQVEEYEIEIPSRSFVRGTVDDEHKQILDTGADALRAVANGEMKGRQAMGLWGEDTVARMRGRIEEGIDPPLAESTVKARAGGGKGEGGDTPLYDTGHLVRSIAWRVK